MMMMGGRNTGRYPFTASQWQELEHQALIFKYMASGMPIPSELIIHMRRSYLLDSAATAPSLAFAPQPSMGWSCYQMGFGSRKPEDPEPGRCRRTDGKKWRCSKEAYGESKYCERHMHRGKNRSRKPVEIPASSSISPSSSHLSISQPETNNSHQLKYPYSTVGFQPLHNSIHQDIPSDYRYCDGVKDVGEYSFLSPLGAERGSSWELRPLGMSSFGEEKEEEKHCYVLGADFKQSKPAKEEEAQRPLRHFFGEWPQKDKDGWMDLEGDHAYSKTQLSISMPMPYHDFPVTSSRYHNNDD